MQTTIYIRKENEEFWERLGRDKSKWVNEQITNGGTTDKITYEPVKPRLEDLPTVYSTRPDLKEPTPKLKVLDNNDLKALLGSSGKQPIEAAPTHVCKDNCKHWVWDTNRGGRVNTLTGEFLEGEPW